MAAALALLISAYCFTDEVCFRLTLSSRDNPDLEDIAGPTLSTVTVRIGIPEDHRMADLLETIQTSLLAMRRHQHYGLHNIARPPVEGTKNTGQFRTLLVIQNDWIQFTDKNVVQDLVPELTSMHINYRLVLII